MNFSYYLAVGDVPAWRSGPSVIMPYFGGNCGLKLFSIAIGIDRCPDEIPARLLRELADFLGPVLTILYQSSVNTGNLPLIWESATVAPVFKKGTATKQ